MLEVLCNNLEIRSFLDSFPQQNWKKVIEAASVLGIRKLKSHKVPITMSTIDGILSPSQYNIKYTLNSMKQELKELCTAIKRIERKTQSSADIFKENELEIGINTKKSSDPSMKERTNSTRALQKVSPNIQLRPSTPCFTGFSKELKEPRICPLGDAKRLIRFANPPRTAIPGSTEIMKIANEFLSNKSNPLGQSIIKPNNM
ncbi:hypothetical protein SteCoe_1139 [Stentor coeruleus]|uniref:Uncharacterized protein n=1 Tax=Stentor coeruleus TaxID=5963 RepID=A0A1R2D2P3_9CILI|nr:hypothetical protein SteCoe_1139 [Stentor coeruleus]